MCRVLPFRLWTFFVKLGTRMDNNRDAFAKVTHQSANALDIPAAFTTLLQKLSCRMACSRRQTLTAVADESMIHR